MKAISLKFNEKQLEELEEMVKNSGKNRSELIRDRIFNRDTSDTRGDTIQYKKLLRSFFELMDDKMEFTKEPSKKEDQLIDEVMELLDL